MSSRKADLVAVAGLETRIESSATPVTGKAATPCAWDAGEVVPIQQSSRWDARVLLFVGLSSELKPVGV